MRCAASAYWGAALSAPDTAGVPRGPARGRAARRRARRRGPSDGHADTCAATGLFRRAGPRGLSRTAWCGASSRRMPSRIAHSWRGSRARPARAVAGDAARNYSAQGHPGVYAAGERAPRARRPRCAVAGPLPCIRASPTTAAIASPLSPPSPARDTAFNACCCACSARGSDAGRRHAGRRRDPAARIGAGRQAWRGMDRPRQHARAPGRRTSRRARSRQHVVGGRSPRARDPELPEAGILEGPLDVVATPEGPRARATGAIAQLDGRRPRLSHRSREARCSTLRGPRRKDHDASQCLWAARGEGAVVERHGGACGVAIARARGCWYRDCSGRRRQGPTGRGSVRSRARHPPAQGREHCDRIPMERGGPSAVDRLVAEQDAYPRGRAASFEARLASCTPAPATLAGERLTGTSQLAVATRGLERWLLY